MVADKASILIVDDNISMSKTLSLVFKFKGFSVDSVCSGKEAIAKVKNESYDLIFMDIQMPSMNGVETLKKIKVLKRDTVVIMMTAYSVENLVREALKEGAHEIIYKPFDIEGTISLIERLIKITPKAVILVIDDDPGTCVTLKNILGRKGYKIFIADSGARAINIIKKKNCDIIFIDLKLPDMNGFEVFLAIKKIQPDAIVVMMTGLRQEMVALVEKALDAGAYACLYKPLDMERVIRLIEEIPKKDIRN